MRPTRTRASVVLASLIIAVAVAHAQVGGGFDLTWTTIDGGGTSASAGGTWSLAGTIAQPDASPFSPPLSGGSWSLVGGFWPVAAPACTAPGDLDAIAGPNGLDIQAFINCLQNVNAQNCSCADLNNNGQADPADIPAFVALLLGN